MSKIIGVTHIIFCKYPICKSAFAYRVSEEDKPNYKIFEYEYKER